MVVQEVVLAEGDEADHLVEVDSVGEVAVVVLPEAGEALVEIEADGAVEDEEVDSVAVEVEADGDEGGDSLADSICIILLFDMLHTSHSTRPGKSRRETYMILTSPTCKNS